MGSYVFGIGFGDSRAEAIQEATLVAKESWFGTFGHRNYTTVSIVGVVEIADVEWEN